jgi:hypothetical protein
VVTGVLSTRMPMIAVAVKQWASGVQVLIFSCSDKQFDISCILKPEDNSAELVKALRDLANTLDKSEDVCYN